MSAEQFSPTLAADFAAGIASQAQMGPAITWLRSNTTLGKLTDIQIWLALQSAIASGNFVISFAGVTMTAAV
jgi:hypothetical protein